MKILMLSWRDIKHPFKGGAEVYTYEILKRLVKRGHQVTWFASSWSGCECKEETLNGIKIIRDGSKFSVYWKAYKYYKNKFKGKFDIVIDQINTIPFFTPLYVKEKKIALIFQLARDVWFSETRFPINILGYLLEPLYLRLYKNQKIITISRSTKKDLNNLGINNIKIVQVGLSINRLRRVPKKEKNLTIIYVGRLKKSKRVQDVIKAFKIVKTKIKNSKLWIVGTGTYKTKLKKLVRKFNLQDSVTFFGFVDEKNKKELMSRAHFICVTSKREGWGMIVTEANARGTPAIVYNSSGLRDAVKDGFNGVVIEKNNPDFLSDCIMKIYSNSKRYKAICKNSLINAKRFDWNKTTDLFEKCLRSR